MAARPEAVLGGPFVVLLFQGLESAIGYVFRMVVKLGARIAHVDFVELAVGQTERSAAAIPVREALIFVFAAIESRALYNIPDVVARTACEARANNLGSVGRLPAELGVRGDVGVDAAVEGGERNAEALVELGHLRNLPPAERGVAGLADATEFFRLAVSEQQVAYERFAANTEFVGKDEPRTNQKAAFGDKLDDLFAAFRADFEIVLQRNGLRIHVE